MKSKKLEKKKPSELRKKAEDKLTSQIAPPKVMSDKETQQLIHELQVHQIDLEMQNEELRKSQTELEESRSKYSDLYDFGPVGYFTFDKQGLIVEANLTATKELGVEKSLLINKPFRTYIVSEDKNIFDHHLQNIFRSDEHQNCDIKLKRKSGSEFYAQLKSIAANDLKGNTLCRTSVIDITERKRSAEALDNTLKESLQHQDEVTALLKSSRAILQYSDFKEAARSIFDTCKNLIGATAGYVALLSADETRNELLFLEAGGRPCTVDRNLPMPIRGLREEAYRTGTAVFENGFMKSEWWGLMPKGHVTLDNVLFAPFVIEGKAVGLLGLANKTGGFTEHDAHIATAFSELAAIALLNSRTLTSLHESEERFCVLNKELEQRVIDRTTQLEAINRELRDEIDIRQHAEKTLYESEQRLSRFYESGMLGVIYWNMHGQITDANDKFLEMVGYSQDDLSSGKIDWVNMTPPEYRYLDDNSVAELKATGINKTPFEKEYIRKDGTRMPIILAGAMLDEKRFNGVAFVLDITERKLAEDKLKEMLMQQKAILDNIPDIAWLKDKQSRYIAANEPFGKASGVSPENVIGKTDLDLWPTELAHKYRADDAYVIELGKRRQFEELLLDKDGKAIWVETIKTPIYNKSGEVIATIGIARDITERKRTEEIIQSERNKLKSILDTMNDGIYIASQQYDIEYINPVIEKDFGLVNGRKCYEYFHDRTEACPWCKNEEVFAGRSVQWEWSSLKTGKTYDLFDTPLRNAYGSISKLEIFHDITDRKEAEKRTQVINTLLKLFANTSSRKEYLDAVVDLLKNYSGCQNIGIRVLDAHGNIPYESTVGFSKEFIESECMLSIERYQFACTRVIGERPEPQDASSMSPAGSFCCNNTIKFVSELSDEEKARFRGTCVQSGFLSVAIIPIRYRNEMIGAIHIADEKEEKVSLKLIESIELLSPFIGEAIHRFSLEEEMYNNYFKESAINMILSLSLEKIPFDEFLNKSLKMVLAIPWLSFESSGSISLVGDSPEVLEMKAWDNISEPLQKLCARVPFGKCLCGRAALNQKIEFADHIDERHEIWHEGMPPHGHYITPILFGGKTLGVINIYLNEGHVRNQKEEDFLIAVADTLAGIIMRRQAEDKIEYLAYYDELTELANRNLFIDRVSQGIARDEYIKKPVGVMVVNIDRFKSINDAYGLHAGDYVLKEVSRRLFTSIREGDTVARLGGDDFGVLLIDVAQSEDVILIVEKIMRNNSYPIHVDGKDIVVTLSMGISVYPIDGKDALSLMKNADLALLKAKQQGRKNYQFFTEDMDVKASEFVLIERNLFSALQNDEFILHYQPYWDINTKKMTGMEALVRWKSPELGLVSPGRFIPVLEDTGMIIEVGEWILKEAMRQVKEWQNNGYSIVPVSVNMSLVQFKQKDLAGMVKKIMKDIGYYPSLLTLEITESAFMQDIEFTRSVLTEMKEIGCSVSIDDFGTGYSSLAYLKRLPIDNLKIDISFIREMVKDPDSASIVMAIINMAHTLNLKTIAEGIETEEQWNFLRLLRCDMGQGFYLSKPLPAEEFVKLLI